MAWDAVFDEPMVTRPWKGAMPSTASRTKSLSSLYTLRHQAAAAPGDHCAAAAAVPSYGITVATGPNTSCCVRSRRRPRGSAACSSVGATKKPFLPDAERLDRLRPAADALRALLQPRDARAHVVELLRGGDRAHGRRPRARDRRPSRAARRSRSASSTASTFAAGTYTRRMAVHFCPVFCVMSRTTSPTNRFSELRAVVDVGPEHRGVEAVGLDVARAPTRA